MERESIGCWKTFQQLGVCTRHNQSPPSITRLMSKVATNTIRLMEPEYRGTRNVVSDIRSTPYPWLITTFEFAMHAAETPTGSGRHCRQETTCVLVCYDRRHARSIISGWGLPKKDKANQSPEQCVVAWIENDSITLNSVFCLLTMTITFFPRKKKVLPSPTLYFQKMWACTKDQSKFSRSKLKTWELLLVRVAGEHLATPVQERQRNGHINTFWIEMTPESESKRRRTLPFC